MFNDAQNKDDPPLSVSFSKASLSVHSVSDALVNARLLGLFTDRTLYAGAIGCFYLVFEHLETHMEASAAKEPRLLHFLQAARPLYRASAFKRDLEYFLGPEWREYIARNSSTPAVRAYLQQLDTLADQQPLLLVAHSYTQHLAVASGGQILAKVVRKGLNVDADALASFSYAMSRPRDLKLEFKRTIDDLGGMVSRDEFRKLVDEHCGAFAYNNSIIKAYKIGWITPFLGFVKFLGTSTALMAAAIAVAMYLLWGGQGRRKL